MKFKVERDTILKEVSLSQEIISSRNSLSVLSNVLIETADGTLVIRATDLKIGFETKIPAEVTEQGRTTVFCDKLVGILRALPSGEVSFELASDGSLTIKPLFKNIDFQLRSIQAEKFPELQLIADEAYFEVGQREFLDMVSQTIFAVSDDETRYFMNGVYMENIEGDLVMVATDGRRLAFVRKTPEQELKEFDGIIVPPKVLQIIKKLASGDGTFSMAVTEKNLFVQFENQKISSALIEGQFPNYQRVIPESQTHTATLVRDELLEALRRVSLLVEKSKRIYLNIAEGALTLSSEESEVGVAHEEISCEYEGPETKIAVNYAYVLDPLRVIGSDNITINFTEATRALTLYSVPREDYFHIVMPMQLD
jgi:DNA polymerase III subunit beta